MKQLLKTNGQFVASADGTVAGLVYTDFNSVIKFLKIYNAEPEPNWFDCCPHYDEASDMLYDVALCYISPIEKRNCINGIVNIKDAFVIAFSDKEYNKTIYVLSDLVLEALGERELVITGECCNGTQH